MKLNLKSKLLFLLLLPLSFIVFMYILIFQNTLETKHNLEKTKEYLLEVQGVSKIIHAAQIERGMSVYYLFFKTDRVKTLLEAARKELDSSIQSYYLMMSISAQHVETGLKERLNGLSSYREKINHNASTKNAVMQEYTQLINEMLKRVNLIPSLTKDSQNSTYIRAYIFLLNAKESMGKMRASMLELFLEQHNVDDLRNAFHLNEEFKKNMSDFETVVPFEFLAQFQQKIKEGNLAFTLEIIKEVLLDKEYKINAENWFEITTESINNLLEIEKDIFTEISHLTDAKIESTLFQIYRLNMLLLFSIFSITVLMGLIYKRILKKTYGLEQSFEESEQLLEQYKATVDMCFIVSKTDPKGVITYVNNEFCKISGFDEKELLGQSHNLVRHGDTPKKIFQTMWYTIKELKKPWVGKVKNRKKDGSEYWVKAIINPILTAQGKVIEYIAIRTDITELEKTKEHFKQQFNIKKENYNDIFALSKLYENAIEQSNLILRFNTKREITYANALFYEKSGYSPEELIGQEYKSIKRPKEISEQEVEDIWIGIEKGEIWTGQIVNIDKYGQPYYSLATVVPIKNAKGEILEYMSIRKDITEIFVLNSQLNNIQQEIIFRMGEIAETRSQETGNHVKRVAYYSKLLAQLYGLCEKDINIVFAASPMHDIGKVGISDAILNKPDKLTPDEFEAMKKHALLGYNILHESKGEVFQAAAVIAKEHHERYDGKGYPHGLKAEEIHIFGRITALADVFDALGHDRVYKKAWGIEQILALFEEEKGKHFDPLLVELFFQNLDQFLTIKDSLEESQSR